MKIKIAAVAAAGLALVALAAGPLGVRWSRPGAVLADVRCC